MTTAQRPLRHRILDGEPLLATFSILASAPVIEMIALAGFDVVIIDLEHGPFDIGQVPPLLMAARARGMAAIVRVRAAEPSLVSAALDAGADGVLIPQVTTAAIAREMVAAARFAPEGRRGVNPWVRAADYGGDAGWFARANDSVAIMVMVEGAEGIANLPEILETPGIDAIFLGPVDLSQSLGVAGQPEHPRVVAAMEEVHRSAAARSVATAVFSAKADAARRWMDRGVRFVAVCEDSDILLRAVKALVAEVRQPAG